MEIEVIAFGIAKDIIAEHSISINLDNNQCKVSDLRGTLNRKFPQLGKVSQYMIAINESYAQESDIINDNDTVVIIPPVSGG